MADSGVEGKTLEFMPSWVVALVCFSIVLISLLVERFLLCAGQLLERSKRKPLVAALLKVKDELMLLGFISLLLAVFQTRIGKICISQRLANMWLPCKKRNSSSTTARFTNFFRSSGTRGRHLLAEASVSASTDFCGKKGKVPLLTVEALHHLDIFIFVLATFHVITCLLKILLGYLKTLQWKNWEDADVRSNEGHRALHQKQQESQCCLPSIGKKSKALGWMCSFFKQFYPSVTKFEYLALHLNFMVSSPQVSEEKDFPNYIINAMEKDFEKIVGISWYLWMLAVIFLLVNVAGWHAYLWISFIPLTLLLIAGTILEHTITRLAEDVAKNHPAEDCSCIENSGKNLVVKFPNGYFWFRRHQFVLHLIHIVLFENSLELISFFFVLFEYGFHSCIMGKVGFVVPRIVIGVLVQFMCIYRTLPLYMIMKSQVYCCDETKIHLNESAAGEVEEMWDLSLVIKIWNCCKRRMRRERSEVATRESTKNGSQADTEAAHEV